MKRRRATLFAMPAYTNSNEHSFFNDTCPRLHKIIQHLESNEAKQAEHGNIEAFINIQGTEVLRRLFQGFLNLKAADEKTQRISANNGTVLNHVRKNCKRNLESLFGQVVVRRKGYNQRGYDSRLPTDTGLNLPEDKYSDGLKLRTVTEAIRGSFYDAADVTDNTTGGHVPERQAQKIVQDVAQDFEDFYLRQRYLQPEPALDLLVISTDAKGIVMQTDSLRPCTRQTANKQNKLKGRLSAGEKKNRKRMAQVASVYTAKAAPGTPESVMRKDEDTNVCHFKAPPRNKQEISEYGQV